MSWLCGGSGVSNVSTIKAGHQALAQQRWDRSKKLFDQAWKRNANSHGVIIDTCEHAVAQAVRKHEAIRLPEPVTVQEGLGVEPDQAASAKYKKENAARRAAYASRKRASLTQLNRLHYLAKHYHKSLVKGLTDPCAVADACTQIAAHHRALSATSPGGYNKKHNQRALDYFGRAIEGYAQAHVTQPAPIAGRMDATTERLMHTSDHWYKTRRKDQQQNTSAQLFRDFVSLISMPASREERLGHLQTLSLLMQSELQNEQHSFLLQEVMAPLTAWLTDASEEAAALRVSVLRVFQQIIYHQVWAKHDAGHALHSFVSDAGLDLTLEHMQVLYACYRGLIDGKSEEHGRYDVLPDLDILRSRLRNNDKALIQVVVLLDEVIRFGSPRLTADAAAMMRTIGMDSDADNVKYTALVNFDHLASFNKNAHVSMALEHMAILIGSMKNEALRNYGIVRIAFHNRHPARMQAADYVLHSTLGLKPEFVQDLLSRHAEVYQSIVDIEANTPVPIL